MTKKQLIKLTNQWYDKLATSGFKDIEWYDKRTGIGQNADYLKHSAFKIRYNYNQNTAEHYRILTNFTTHYEFDSKRDRFILELYCDGITYRRILEKCRTKGNGYGYTMGKRSLSLGTLHALLSKYIKIAYEWDKTNPNGLSYNDTLEK